MSETEISIVFPVRNEYGNFLETMKSLLNQEISVKFEIIVVDGSEDDKIVKETKTMIEEHGTKIRLFKNLKKSFSAGMNLGIKNAFGKYIVEFGAHGRATDPEWLKTIYTSLIGNKSLVKVGTVHECLNTSNSIARSIGIVQNSFIGGSSISTFRKNENNNFQDSVGFGIASKKNIEKAGCYDENYYRGSDLDLNLRLKKYGKLLKLNEPAFKHKKSETLSGWFKKMWGYGFARKTLILNGRRPITDLIPIIPYILGIPILLLCFLTDTLIVFISLLSLYLIIFLTAAIVLAVKNKFIRVDLLFAVGIITHIAYSVGFLSAFIHRF